jgi:hypothetical protein
MSALEIRTLKRMALPKLNPMSPLLCLYTLRHNMEREREREIERKREREGEREREREREKEESKRERERDSERERQRERPQLQRRHACGPPLAVALVTPCFWHTGKHLCSVNIHTHRHKYRHGHRHRHIGVLQNACATSAFLRPHTLVASHTLVA